ncbi:MAG: hypothetical protein ABIK09_14600 [Pseudomonadota bacterium]
MDRTLIAITVLSTLLMGSTAGCGATREVERLYIGGWVFLALIFIALLVLLGLVIRYLADGRKQAPTTPPRDTLPPPKDTDDPNDWV